MGHWDDFYRPGWLRILGGRVHAETGMLVPWVHGAIELIWRGFRDIDEEEIPASRVAEEAVQETNSSRVSLSSAFVPATDEGLVAHCPRDQSSQCQVL